MPTLTAQSEQAFSQQDVFPTYRRRLPDRCLSMCRRSPKITLPDMCLSMCRLLPKITLCPC